MRSYSMVYTEIYFTLMGELLGLSPRSSLNPVVRFVACVRLLTKAKHRDKYFLEMHIDVMHTILKYTTIALGATPSHNARPESSIAFTSDNSLPPPPPYALLDTGVSYA